MSLEDEPTPMQVYEPSAYGSEDHVVRETLEGAGASSPKRSWTTSVAYAETASGDQVSISRPSEAPSSITRIGLPCDFHMLMTTVG